MLDLKYIRENPEQVREAIRVKQVKLRLEDLLAADDTVRQLKGEIQARQEERNRISDQTRKASPEERPALIARGRAVGEELKSLEPQLREAEEGLQQLLWLVPNIPAPDAPIGEGEDDNIEIKRWGEPRTFDFTPLDHVTILDQHQWAELERIGKVAGSRSYSLRNEMVLLEMTLLRFALDRLREKGFDLLGVPSMAREAAFYGMGHFPTAREQTYQLPADDLYLAGTAEAVLNSLHAGEILNASDLPIRYAGYSPCFRREAGSAGKDVRGLIRVHQFYKVEQYVICQSDPEESARWHQQLLTTAEEIVQALELPYRVVECCTGDMGVGKFRMNDLETWLPGENRYRETHSCSSLHDWQARRTGVRYRDEDGRVRFCHTLNNTALATPRIIAPFLENHQQADGSIYVPPALRPYLGGAERLG